MQPFAYLFRPETINEIIGQSHLVGKNKLINKLLENKFIPNMIFYGPPGTGKTTLAKIIAKNIGFKYVELNATNIGVKDIKEILIENIDSTILFIDEFHLLNRRQQQVLLDSTEKGDTILIASTTENPYFAIYKAVLSRCNILEFKMLNDNDIFKGLTIIKEKIKNEFKNKDITIDDDVLKQIASNSSGDFRSAINLLELMFYKNLSPFNNSVTIKLEDLKDITINKNFNFDKNGDCYYDTLSAFHKSLRGSSPDAAIHYLARLIKGGDLISITRRLLCVASEDVGLANPEAINIVKNCVDSALQLGLPEARLPLAQATIYLAIQPKSNSVMNAIDSAINDLENKSIEDIPSYLKDSHYNGASNLNHGNDYLYPHNYENNWVKQDYLPSAIKDNSYYVPGNNKMEQLYLEYWKGIKKQ